MARVRYVILVPKVFEDVVPNATADAIKDRGREYVYAHNPVASKHPQGPDLGYLATVVEAVTIDEDPVISLDEFLHPGTVD